MRLRRWRPSLAGVRGGLVRLGRWRPSRPSLAGVRGGFARLGRLRLVVLVVLVGAGSGVAIGAGTSAPGGPAKPRPVPVDLLADGPPSPVVATVAETAPPLPAGKAKHKGKDRAGAEYYRRTARRRVPKAAETGFLPLYREAARAYGVNWRLIASIHRQETAFSTVPGTYRGLNSFGCCGGPMQFNVTNGPVSTWDAYKQSFRAGTRPASYPHRTRHHPSLYDDFDAMMAAGKLLSDAGAGPGLDGGSWLAAYGYYGHDNFGVTYASQVVARARGWERDGFCVNCALDQGIFAALDDAYGVSARQELAGAAQRSKEEKERKKKAKEKRKKAKEKAKREQAKREKAKREAASKPEPSGSKSPSGGTTKAPTKSPSKPPTTASEPPTQTTPTTSSPAAPPAPAPSKPDPSCNGLKHVLGGC